MPSGIVLIKGLQGKYKYTYEFLRELKKKETLGKDLEKKNLKIVEVFLSMGWPDMILLVEADQILDIQQAISYIKEELKSKKRRKEHRDLIDTSTIVCVKEDEREQIKQEIAEELRKEED